MEPDVGQAPPGIIPVGDVHSPVNQFLDLLSNRSSVRYGRAMCGREGHIAKKCPPMVRRSYERRGGFYPEHTSTAKQITQRTCAAVAGKFSNTDWRGQRHFLSCHVARHSMRAARWRQSRLPFLRAVPAASHPVKRLSRPNGTSSKLVRRLPVFGSGLNG